MKILGGIYRGTNLYLPKDADIRPALARMRNSLFNILMERIEGRRVLDLFAGSGSLGFEALSRGAEYCLFIDNNNSCITALQKSVAKLHLQDRTRILQMDSFNIVKHIIENKGGRGKRFDIIFIDPPYAYYNEENTKQELISIIDEIAQENIISNNGLILVEHRCGDIKGNEFKHLKVVDKRDYGQTSLLFLTMSRR
ncbi:MAG: 16S rRNA (guanine(966)-N(2))-methyltransferase RsmD [Planctomycetota bacterium]|nr:16S rRNA (guanine(966)-N(2))-methyltransferase RsmD [Planctomycetota bacterium]MDI6787685.1 16S rRNA (guanine(966)-N(2))-methyltransferase RsmD [Planctomycetota bacterium]